MAVSKVVSLACVCSALALAAFGLTPAIASADWPIYGKDLANSRDGGTEGPPRAAAATLSQAWRFESTDGDFTGTPVVASGTVVAGSGGGSVFALDAATGGRKWSRDFDQPINGSAAIASGRVYIPLATPDSPELAALSLADGSLLWTRTLDTQKDSDTFGSPVVWNGTVFIGTSSLFGELNDPDVNVRGSVVALDARTGRRKWKTFTVPPGLDGGSVWSTPAIDTATGRLFVGTGNAYHEPAADTTDSILALDTKSGRILDHFQATPGDVWNATTGVTDGPDADFGASPNLITGTDGRPLVGEGQKSGTYWAVDRSTLDPVWNTTVGPPSFVGGILGSTAYDGSQVYGPNTPGGEIWALGRDGSVAWLSLDADPVHFAPVAVANGVVYGNDMAGFLNARDAGSGLLLARYPLGGPSWGGVSIAAGTIFTVTGIQGDSGFIQAFRPPAA
jgi:polyvinyl alcohol dehydrogenase (cytochrome)